MALKRLFRFRLRTMLGLVLAASIFCAYVSNYLLTLNPAIHITNTTGGFVTGHREADYESGGQFSQTFFAPIHYIDRQIRPTYWNYWNAFDEIGDFENLNIYREPPANHTPRK